MSNLIASAGTKEDLEKMINEYYFSTNYIITENNDVYNTKKECTLDTVKVEVKRNRWKLLECRYSEREINRIVVTGSWLVHAL